MSGALAGRVALVTGAGSGIGRAIVEAFLGAGARVVGMDLGPQAPLEGLVAVAGDVTQPDQCRAAVAAAVGGFGGLHVLVNNAAAPPAYGTVVEFDLAAWERVLAVNLTGAMLTSRFAVPAIAACGGGSIIHVASQLGRVGTARNPAYCATKGALIQLAKVMAIDHAAQNIRVNTLSPGAVGTERIFRQHAVREEAERLRGPAHVLGRMARPDEIASAALFLAGEASSFMTGADLLVDGGYTAW
ncbi:MAG: SDR family oxidoreductase [Acetobacteraceae bacterium]|nr:SDR family oxidoreductase [Acetobacteraceae bacterium]